MNTQAKVSILIPAYNAENSIVATIESALGQTWPNTEIVVVDDGSRDATHEIASRFQARGVIAHRQENRGAAAARNTALKLCHGEFIQYLDADDLLSPNKIAVQMARLAATQRPCIASCAWGKFQDCPQRAVVVPQDLHRDLDPIDWLIKSWTGGGMMQTACWLASRATIDAAGPWNEQLPGNPNDDGEFFCRVLLHCEQVLYCPQALVFYRTPGIASVSQVRSRQQAQSLLGSFLAYESHLLRRDPSSRSRAAVANNYYRFCYQFDPAYPELLATARDGIRRMGSPPPQQIGTPLFQRLTRLLGFFNALRARSVRRSLVPAIPDGPATDR